MANAAGFAESPHEFGEGLGCVSRVGPQLIVEKTARRSRRSERSESSEEFSNWFSAIQTAMSTAAERDQNVRRQQTPQQPTFGHGYSLKR